MIARHRQHNRQPSWRIQPFRNCGEGDVTLGFIVLFPVLLVMFLAALEIGVLTLRQVALERAVDLTVRDLRLGHFNAPTQNDLRVSICGRADTIPQCMDNLLIEFRPVSSDTGTSLDTDTTCKNRDASIHPVVSLNPGGVSEMMLVRVCAVFTPVFPTTRLGLHLNSNALVSSAAFMNEPT